MCSLDVFDIHIYKLLGCPIMEFSPLPKSGILEHEHGGLLRALRAPVITSNTTKIKPIEADCFIL